MEVVTRKGEGLFPEPSDLSLSCSCPDWAVMCKHVAASLYGVGARLDHAPELLFTLRGVDPTEMVEEAVLRTPARSRPRRGRALASEDLSSVFGVDIDLGDGPAKRPRAKTAAAKEPSAKKPPTKKAAAKTPKSKKAAPEQPRPKKTPAKKTKAKQAAPEQPRPRKTPAKQPRPRKAAAKKTEAKRPVGRKAAAKGAAENPVGGKTKREPLQDAPSEAILSWLEADGGWSTKAEILAGTGLGAGLWTYSRRLLLAQGLLEKQGAGQGTRYRAR